MIEMSRAVSPRARLSIPARAVLVACMLAAGALSATLAGCCGGGPSHKCDFTPPNLPHDGGSADGPLPCGTQICSDTQVCCVTRVPLNATCIDQDPVKFMQLGCEKIDLSCASPSQCPSGFICCLKTSDPQTLSCGPPQICDSSDGMHFVVCSSDMDCPSQAAGSCRVVASLSDGTNLSACF